MALSKDERRKQLEQELADLDKPEPPAGNVNFTLPLDSDVAWERAIKAGIIRDDSKDGNGDEGDGDEGKGGKGGRGRRGFFGDEEE